VSPVLIVTSQYELWLNISFSSKLGKSATDTPTGLNTVYAYKVLKNLLRASSFHISFSLKIVPEFQELSDPSMYTEEQIQA
jgi:hypothetical protein